MSISGGSSNITDTEVLDFSFTGTETVIIDCSGSATLSLQISGTWVGSLNPTVSLDGVNYMDPISGLDLFLFNTTPGPLDSTLYGLGLNTIIQYAVAGIQKFKLTGSVSSGTAVVSLISSIGSNVLNGSIGNIFISGNVGLNTGTNNVGNFGVAQNSTTAGQIGPLVQGAVTTAAPTYVTGRTDPLSLTTAGALRVDGSGVTQPISAASLPLLTGLALNYGVATAALRTASQIGNTTGQADFNAGVTGAQTLRATVNITRNGTELSYNAGTSDANTLRVSSNITRNGTELSYNFGASDANTLRAAALIGNSTGAADFNAGAATAQTLRVTSSNFPTTLDTNYGTVGASTLRTAAEIGNATGAALFGAGTTTAQVLRVVLPTDQTVIPVQGQKTNNNAAPGATNLGVLPGIATAAVQTWTEGNQVALSTDLGGRQRVLNTPTTGILQTYAASGLVTSVALATDIFSIIGSATKTVMITNLVISGIATSANVVTVNILKRSTADTVGTPTTLTNVPLDSSNAAATAVCTTYAGVPTTGTLVGNIKTFKVFLPPPTGGSANSPSFPISFPGTFSQPITLRGAAQTLAVNLGGVTIAGAIFAISVEWIEF